MQQDQVIQTGKFKFPTSAMGLHQDTQKVTVNDRQPQLREEKLMTANPELV